MKNIIIILILGLPCSLIAQTGEKGVIPVENKAASDSGTTRAVVIGISDYEDPEIPDLQFANKDALAFAEFLRSKTGGNLNEDQLMILTDSQATESRIYFALDWLRDESEEGDQAIIYFSGHGDADIKLHSQPGLLLTYNSTVQTPKITSLELSDLEDYLTTISLDKKARVILVTDACRSGKLASREGGSKLANLELAALDKQAVKILSCQADELSWESVQWGGGRGVFSYFLVTGLYGMADNNKDKRVTLTEIERYLEDNVSREVSPSSQIPKVIGNPKEKITKVFEDELAKVMEQMDPNTVKYKPIVQRGIEDETLANVDSLTRKLYKQFKEAVVANAFFEPIDSCADTLYTLLMQVAGLQPLYNSMRRNYAAALMDDAQEAMNGWLRSDPRETMSWSTKRKNDYQRFPHQLARAAEILGNTHYLYNDLKAKEYFFRARVQIVEMGGDSVSPDSPLLPPLLQTVEAGLKYDSTAPYLYAKKAYYYTYRNEHKIAAELMQKALDLAPGWTWAYNTLCYIYFKDGNYRKEKETAYDAYHKGILDPGILNNLKNYTQDDHQIDESKLMGKKTIELMDSRDEYDDLLSYRANQYWGSGYPDKAEKTFKKYIKQVLAGDDNKEKSKLWFPYHQLGWVLTVKGEWDEAERWYKMSDSIKENSLAKAGLFQIAHKKGQHKLAKKYLKSAIKTGYYKNPQTIVYDGAFLLCIYDWVDEVILLYSSSLELFPKFAPLRYDLGRIYLEQKNDYRKGISLLKKAVKLDSTHAYARYHLAAAYAHIGKNEAALKHLDKALEAGFDEFEQLAGDSRWSALCDTQGYKALIAKYKR